MKNSEPVYKPADYAKGTVMQPEHVSTIKASFGEYEALGEKHRNLSQSIEKLQEKMKHSRQIGAFQTLQDQMREVKNLVKEREQIDALMAVANLSRKQDDDHRLEARQEVSYSERIDSVSRRIEALGLSIMDFSKERGETWNFTRCQRPDGSTYGTKGKCKKGSEVGTLSPAKPTNTGRKPRATTQELKEYQAKVASLVRVLSKQKKEAALKMKESQKLAKKDKNPNNLQDHLQNVRDWERKSADLEKAKKEWTRSYDAWARSHHKGNRNPDIPLNK